MFSIKMNIIINNDVNIKMNNVNTYGRGDVWY